MALMESDIAFLCDVVANVSGNVISSEQGYLLESRLRPVAESEGLATVETLVRELRTGRQPKLESRVVEAMTINETFFFRDQHPYELLRSTIVPELLQSRQSEKKLSIWCAACSSGQEPYSVAMCLRDHFPELSTWDVKIMASDLSDAILQKAKNGLYSQFEVNRGLPAKYLVRFFDRDGMNWQIKPELRQLLEFRKMNLTKPWPTLPKFDIVFIRNVMIYFSNPTKEDILRRLRKTVASDAYVLLGGGETILNLNTPFTRHAVAGTVCYRPQ
ncbi:MAG: protein-glutamate O-methyltransferase CheR [Pirellulaceae bacterium]